MTMFGIVIGVMSVIMVLSIGEAAQRYIMGQISSFGSDVVFIMNGPNTSASGQPSPFMKESLTQRDVKLMQTQPWIHVIAGRLISSDTVIAQGISTSASIVGTMPDELRLSDIHVQSGEFFTQSSVDSHARDVVLGADVAQAGFGAENPIGKTIKINSVGFRVVGVMQRAGSKGFTNIDKQVFMPMTSALDLYNKKYLTYIEVKTNIANLSDAKQRIAVFIRERHNIDNPTGDLTKDDFHIQTQEDLIKTTSTITNILQILLTSIAAISLLVGGIGIMNIMYVSVTERIKEIGLRKSIGAHKKDILRQFIVEAVVLTIVGGIIGISLGILFSWAGIQIINNLQGGWSFAVSWNGVGLGLGVSAAIGLVFGYFPARKAAGLNPIDALRKE
jgi:putative ABC transport system permease protein